MTDEAFRKEMVKYLWNGVTRPFSEGQADEIIQLMKKHGYVKKQELVKRIDGLFQEFKQKTEFDTRARGYIDCLDDIKEILK